MSRKIIYTAEFPYHITARVNNQEWFALDMNLMWVIFQEGLKKATEDFNLKIHAFILMKNHYHLVATVDERFPLNVVMQWFQYHVTLRVNFYSGNINHVFGGRYKASVINQPRYYYHAIKYLYRNSVSAGVVVRPQDYAFSTLKASGIPVAPPETGIDELMPQTHDKFIDWLNSGYSDREAQTISRALRRAKVSFPARMTKELQKSLCHP